MDFVNALFQVMAGVFVLNHCRVLLHDKQVKGVSTASTMFFVTWGLWNLAYFPSLDQQWSLYGAIFVTGANVIYVAMQVYYKRRTA